MPASRAHEYVGLQPVARHQASPPPAGSSAPSAASSRVAGRLADHGFDLRTGAGLDRRDDGGAVSAHLAAGDRAERVGVGGEEARARPDGVEGGLAVRR
ncbi:MAG: hypothetical protein MZV63_34230 [Marinilabiliales bacterium]|nr:hypothetical protein [Marinilabiliales bacterium]